MNITGLPVTPKPEKAEPNEAYLRNVRALPCVICHRQPCEAHHPIFGRYSQKRAPDEMAIPLCWSCHRELHAGKRTWFAKHGPDIDYVKATQARLAHLMKGQ